MSAPRRVQRQRTKGWRMPENTVYVGRGTKWGNPLRVGDTLVLAAHAADSPAFDSMAVKIDPDVATDFYRLLLRWRHAGMPPAFRALPMASQVRAELAGRNLACWCPTDQPCHADVLLQIANEEGH